MSNNPTEEKVYAYVMQECTWEQKLSGRWVATISLIDEEYSSEGNTGEMARHALAYKAATSDEMSQKALEEIKNKSTRP